MIKVVGLAYLSFASIGFIFIFKGPLKEKQKHPYAGHAKIQNT